MRSSVNVRKSAVIIELELLPINPAVVSLDVVFMLLQYCSVALVHMSPYGPFKDTVLFRKIWYCFPNEKRDASETDDLTVEEKECEL